MQESDNIKLMKNPSKSKIKTKKALVIIEENPQQSVDSTCTMDLQNMEGLQYLQTVQDNSIDLILTDPPYIISKDSGMNDHYNNVKFNEENQIEFVKTEEEWQQYKASNNILDDSKKDNYLKN